VDVALDILNGKVSLPLHIFRQSGGKDLAEWKEGNEEPQSLLESPGSFSDVSLSLQISRVFWGAFVLSI